MTPPTPEVVHDVRLHEHVTATRRALVRIRDRQQLLDEACRLAVEVGGFRMAWIGWVDESDVIVPVARAGHVDGYLDDIAITVRGTTGAGPSGRAVRSGRPQICQDIEADPAMEPWREAALALGYRSSGAFPLVDDRGVRGILAVYAPATGHFDRGVTTQLVDLATDLTTALQLREEQEARLRAERRFRTLFDHAAEGIFRTDVDGRILELNQAMARILGHDSPDSLLAEVPRVQDLYVDPARRDDAMDGLRVDGEVHDFEVELRRRDASAVWVSITARLVRDEDGPVQIEGFAVDVSARKGAELELRTSRERFRQTFDHAPFGMAIVDLDGRFLEVNRSLCDIVGRSAPELVALTFHDITHPDDLDEDLAYVEQLLAGERTAYEMRKRYVHADGHVVPIRLVGSIVRDADGEPRHFVAQVEDVSEHDRAAAAIAHREAILAAVSDLSEVLLSGGQSWAATMDRELGRLGRAAGADRAGVLEVFTAEDGDRAIRRPHAWATDGVDPLVDDPRLQALSYEAAGYGPWASALAAGQVLNVHVADLDPQQRALLDEVGTRTLLFAPIHVDGAWWGAVSLEGVLADRAWTDIEVDALAAAARVLGAAIANHRAARELEARDRRLTDLVEALPLGVTFVDRDGTLTFANGQAEEILGLRRSEIASRTYDDPAWRITDLDGSPFPTSDLPFARVVAERATIRDVQHAIEHPDGRRTELSINGVPLFDAEGTLAGMVATIDDITDRRRVELTQRRFAAIVESSSDAILAKTLDGIITDWNRGAEEIYGYTAAEAIGQHVSFLAPESRHAEIEDMLARVRAGETIRDHQAERVRRDGARIWVALTISPLRDEAGTVIGVSTVGRDVTDRVEAAAELSRYATELERSNQELEQFAYVASHDLQEPLRMVTSFLQLLARRYEGQLDEQADQFIGFAVDGATRMRRLIEDLLAFSRVGTRGEPFVPIDLGAVVGDVVTDLRAAIDEVGASVEVGDLPVVDGDATQLRQVFLNLVGNALKFHNDHPPRVTIHAERDDDTWTVTVQDDGIGIPPEHAERVFIIFQRLHARAEYPGTGMGLAICKKVVERHGGRIWIDQDGQPGTTIRFTIPQAAEAPRHEHPVHPDRDPPRGGQPR